MVHADPAAKVAVRPKPAETAPGDENKVQRLAVDVAGSRAPVFCVKGTASPISVSVTPNHSRSSPKERPCMNPPGPAMLCGKSYVVTTSVTGSRDAIRVESSSVSCVAQMCVLLAVMSREPAGRSHLTTTPELGRSRRTCPFVRMRANVKSSVKVCPSNSTEKAGPIARWKVAMGQVVSTFVAGFSLPTNTPGAEKNNVPSGATTKSLGKKETGHCFTVAEVRTAAAAGTLTPTTRTMTKMPIKIETRDDKPTGFFDPVIPLPPP